jgi:putative endonuclease
MQKQFYVYIMTNKGNRVLYTGITNNLRRRLREHKRKVPGSFTSKYKIVKLVYFEVWPKAWLAIAREKQIKAGSRKKKIALIESMNPVWRDLADGLWQIASSPIPSRSDPYPEGTPSERERDAFGKNAPRNDAPPPCMPVTPGNFCIPATRLPRTPASALPARCGQPP